jgi:hypothetical protein
VTTHVDTKGHVSVTSVRLELLSKELERDKRDVRVVHSLESLRISSASEDGSEELTIPSSVQSRLPSVTNSLIAVGQLKSVNSTERAAYHQGAS